MTDEWRGLRRDDAAKSEGDRLPGRAVALGAFTAADAERLAELDRSESVSMLYTVCRGEIVPLGRGEEIPQWSGAWLEAVATPRCSSWSSCPSAGSIADTAWPVGSLTRCGGRRRDAAPAASTSPRRRRRAPCSSTWGRARPADPLDPALLALEPEDVHLVLEF